jgi:hypothetical protein
MRPSECRGTRKLTGAKPPLRPKHVWSIRTKFQIEGRTRGRAAGKRGGCTDGLQRAQNVDDEDRLREDRCG